MIVYVTEPNEIEEAALALLRSAGHEVLLDEAAVLARSAEVEALFVRTYTTVDKALLDRFPKLAYVLRAGVGVDNIDTKECERRGVAVINSPGANAGAVAEYTVGAMVYLMRAFPAQQRSLMQGGWRLAEHMGGELRGRVLGLVGCGNVGRLIAHKLSSWELKEMVGYDPFLSVEQLAAAGIRKVELDSLYAAADVVSLHLPLTPETRHSVGAAAFAQMKRGAYFINAARGGVIDEGALVEALRSGHLAGAALDVFESEPQVREELKHAANVLLTPHIAGYTREANREVCMAPVRELLRRVG